MNNSMLLNGFLLFSFSAAITWLVRSASYRFGFVSLPREERWHKKPTALLGGVAIFVAFLTGYLLLIPQDSQNLLLVGCAGAMFLLGVSDDLRSIKPQSKLVTQIVVSVALVYFGPVLPYFDSQLINFLITLLWLIGITNAMNLLDNMDGLCAGVAIIASFYRLVFCSLEGHVEGVMLALVFMMAVAGFLVFNFNPASIFMGDSGSLFIGFMLAGMNVTPGHIYAKSILSVLLFPVLILIIPIFDTALVSMVRKFSGRPISVGGKDHSSHRLVAVGLSERSAVLILYGISVASGAVAYILYQQGFSYTLFFISLFAIGMALFGVYLSKIRVYEEDEIANPDPKDMFRLVADFKYKRQMLLVFLDVFLVITAYYGAYSLRFEGIAPGGLYFQLFLQSFPIVLVLSIVSFFAFGLYRYDWDWRYTGIRDLWVMIKGISVATAAAVLAVTYLYRFEGYSRSVFLIYWGTLLILMAGTRLSFRMLTELLAVRPDRHKKVLIYGAGDGGELLLREFKNNHGRETVVVGFLDDDPRRVKSSIHGVPVLGNSQTAEFWIRKHLVSEIIVSSTKIPSSKVVELQQICSRFEVGLLRAYMKFEKAIS
ncbi:MAG: hypothetical protein ACRD1R_01980 [Acidobacteriota bacterium]